MVCPILISVSVAPVSYFFCAYAELASAAPSASANSGANLNWRMRLPPEMRRDASPRRQGASVWKKRRWGNAFPLGKLLPAESARCRPAILFPLFLDLLLFLLVHLLDGWRLVGRAGRLRYRCRRRGGRDRGLRLRPTRRARGVAGLREAASRATPPRFSQNRRPMPRLPISQATQAVPARPAVVFIRMIALLTPADCRSAGA